ncbi:hypothetical protein N7326_04515 [Corynebacterium sp. ES2794-CONJ1]|uniref:YkvI family membrane protein n=1 Tax=unclassified Corynebacterium TaxID=2624378 RepID=UPI002169EBD7|nr:MULTISPECIES: hypothetical protein [unclassified Corynebacterium]MCS4490001.1 hypothetical protein [Corynebacterium sp. ES2775-CONJ]MCS4491636.1 hypothetical protein [Corynebacterium sp. ES2715-CONJ3]MCS4531741.1 hypothetical protein [Corynebacterium sp. ES2730-CONJ]MCU9519137.1 hypothetical protein [Corynebacterium sp. ES2794-CONJ1]
MFKRVASIALAFIGVIVGAGFATGQEVLQYFVGFGSMGILAAVISSVVVMLSGMAAIQLGSYFLADDHGAVIHRISHPIVGKMLDAGVLVTLFCTGMVMFAGAGSNLNQQFGWPIWVGAIGLLVVVLIAGLLDVDKITGVIGAVTPFIVAFIGLAAVWALTHASSSPEAIEAGVRLIEPATPHWFISSMNYVGLNLMVGASMAIIIGGNNTDPKAAGIGGLIGGIVFGLMLTLTALALYRSVDVVAQDDVPMLRIVDGIHPNLGLLMSIVIIGMIFNTAVGMFYAFAKRLTSKSPQRFYLVFVASCLIGFGASFLGFKTLVATVYPILGYIGVILFTVITLAWIKSLTTIREESTRRDRIRELLRRKLDPRLRFSSKQQRMLNRYVEESNLEREEFVESIRVEVEEEIEEEIAEEERREHESLDGADESTTESHQIESENSREHPETLGDSDQQSPHRLQDH